MSVVPPSVTVSTCATGATFAVVVASAAGVLMSVPVVALVLMMQRYLVRGLTLGAVKG